MARAFSRGARGARPSQEDAATWEDRLEHAFATFSRFVSDAEPAGCSPPWSGAWVPSARSRSPR